MSKKDDSPKNKLKLFRFNFTRQEIIGIVLICIGLCSLFCALQSNFNIVGCVVGLGDEAKYKDSCSQIGENGSNNLNNFEGDRVKFTGIVSEARYDKDVRLIFIKSADFSSDSDILCVIVDSNERKAEKKDLVTVYGFVYGTHLSSNGDYYVPLIINKYIDIKEENYS